ncbi:MAG: 50S ribosomal protein L25 [Buchnera aphidicola (Nurudea shiraii)]
MITIHATKRKKIGTSSSRCIRLNNKIPAVMYGPLCPNVFIELYHNVVFNIILNCDTYKKKLLLIIDHIQHIVKVQSIQRHVFKPNIIHMDFFKVPNK